MTPVVSHFILQNTATFRSDYTTGEKSIMQNKEEIVLGGLEFAALLMPLETSGFGAEPQFYL